MDIRGFGILLFCKSGNPTHLRSLRKSGRHGLSYALDEIVFFFITVMSFYTSTILRAGDISSPDSVGEAAACQFRCLKPAMFFFPFSVSSSILRIVNVTHGQSISWLQQSKSFSGESLGS